MTPTSPSGALPEELVREAREIAVAWCAHIFVDSATEVIARVLMARDERAARIAREWDRTRESVATAITTYSKEG